MKKMTHRSWLDIIPAVQLISARFSSIPSLIDSQDRICTALPPDLGRMVII